MRCHRSMTTMLLLLRSISFGFRASNNPLCSHHQHRRIILTQWQRCQSFLSTKSNNNVEISPSNHGTSPLINFQSSSASLDESLVQTLQSCMNITTPTPIQSAAIPLLLPDKGYDVMASSATGSGKTIMFGLPLLQKILLEGRGNNLRDNRDAVGGNNNSVGRPSSLIIAPTRELAMQISSVLQTFTTSSRNNHTSKIKVCLATGGSDTRKQRLALPNCNILVGTPGRIVQFIDERKLSLNNINYLVIDEADRLLDLGFEKELTRISRSLRSNTNTEKQSVLCSATFPEGVQRLAADFLDPNYYFVSVGVVGSTHSEIRQTFEWMDLPSKHGNGRSVGMKNDRVAAVIRNVDQFWSSPDKKKDQSSVIVFSNTKDGVEGYGKALSKKFGGGKVRVIHGDKEQSQRNKAIDDFKSGRASLLVATDVAARGLDVSSIGLVIQADAPRNIDTYTHRIGRTGRAGAGGNAVTFIDGKSMGIASGLVDLLAGADQSESIPSWLWGMAHVSNARLLEEEMQIQAGSMQKNAVESVVNEDFTEQDFRRTAAEGSYGVGKDTAYRTFEEEAYSDSSRIDDSQLGLYDNKTLADVETDTNPSSLGESTIHSDHDATIFYRQEPSKQLTRAISGMAGAKIDDTPRKNILNSLRSNQHLKFEYIGLFPFDKISSLLMNTSDRSGSSGMTKILMVAEKPSIAKAIADALSGNRPPRQLRGISRALPVYEFTTDKFQPVNGSDSNQRSKCLVRVTSVVGHVYSLGFDFDQNDNKGSNNPRDYFSIKVTKKEETTTSKLRVVDHLKALSADSSHLVLWLDCDPEGENIAHEVIAITRRAILSNASADEGESRRIHRAQFSAITPKAIQDSFSTLQEPNANLSRSVDARQELDLRVGVAITRLLTWKCVNIARRRFSPSTRMVSYGPCQTPALSFCVDRLREIEEFQSKAKKYYKVHMEIKLPNGQMMNSVSWKVPRAHSVDDTRNKSSKSESSATFDHQSAKFVIQKAKEANMIMVVKSVTHQAETMNPPVGLNTVRLLEAGSKAMGMSPKNVMNVAEKLYSAGLISYPRTETTRYDPNGFDAKTELSLHTRNTEWGKSASYLLRTLKSNKPPKTGRDCGDHPPITPLKSASKGEVGGGAAWRVYDFVCRNFIGSLHNDLKFTKTVVVLTIPGSDDEFELEMVTVDSLGFADACRWVLRDIGATSGKNDSVSLKEGDCITITNVSMEEKTQRPPKFLQEHELIREMDEKGIGTDASMAVHVSNIVDREYVQLVDETGTPLRPPLPPGKRKQQLPRQVGRYLVPTPLGASLMELFGHNAVLTENESPALLSHPSIRRQMEQEVKQIARGEIDKESCVKNYLEWFEKRYSELEEILTRDRIHEFGQDLTASNLKYLESLHAFEPKMHIVNKGKETKHSNRSAHSSLKSNRGSRSAPKKMQRRKAHKTSAK